MNTDTQTMIQCNNASDRDNEMNKDWAAATQDKTKEINRIGNNFVMWCDVLRCDKYNKMYQNQINRNEKRYCPQKRTQLR